MIEVAHVLMALTAAFMFLTIGLRILLDFIIEVDHKIDADEKRKDGTE